MTVAKVRGYSSTELVKWALLERYWSDIWVVRRLTLQPLGKLAPCSSQIGPAPLLAPLQLHSHTLLGTLSSIIISKLDLQFYAIMILSSCLHMITQNHLPNEIKYNFKVNCQMTYFHQLLLPSDQTKTLHSVSPFQNRKMYILSYQFRMSELIR